MQASAHAGRAGCKLATAATIKTLAQAGSIGSRGRRVPGNCARRSMPSMPGSRPYPHGKVLTCKTSIHWVTHGEQAMGCQAGPAQYGSSPDPAAGWA